MRHRSIKQRSLLDFIEQLDQPPAAKPDRSGDDVYLIPPPADDEDVMLLQIRRDMRTLETRSWGVEPGESFIRGRLDYFRAVLSARRLEETR